MQNRTMMEFDADAASRVEAAYTTPDIVAQRDRVRAALALEPGEQVLDVGVGPGFLAAEMAAEVDWFFSLNRYVFLASRA
jgi:protein-L-isoaspartate O-methyltransferase